MSNVQLIEKAITIDNPGTGEPITVNLRLEVELSCQCAPTPPSSPGNPAGWLPKQRRN